MISYLLYIELPANMRTLLIFIILIIIFVFKVISDKRKAEFKRTQRLKDPFSSFSVPLYLIRAHTGRFVLKTFKNFDIVKPMYLNFLKKYKIISAGDENEELRQLKFLIDNKVNVEKTIEKGKLTAHKNRLLILIFLFNVAIRDGYISVFDKTYLDNVYIDLGISNDVYQSIKKKYIRDNKKSDYAEQQSDLVKAYKVLELKPHTGLKEVKRAYRKLAKKYHPDVYKSDVLENIEFAELKFTEITMAYDYLKKVLS